MVDLIIPALHPGQQQLADEADRFNVVCCGRRWGKTAFGLDRVIDTERLGMLDGKPCGWFAGTTKIADAAWADAVRALEPITAKKDSQHRRLDLTTGGSLEIWSLESTGVGLGRRYGVAVIDEAAIAKDLLVRWLREIRPTLTDYRGTAWFLSTPRGRLGDFYDLHQRGGVKPGWRSWQMPSRINPYLDPEEIEEARQGYLDLGRQDLFQQEYLAEFVVAQGAVYDPSKVGFGKVPRITRLYLAVDPALTESELSEGDETAIAVVGQAEDGTYWIVDLLHGRWGPEEVGERVLEACRRYDPGLVLVEGGPAGLGVLPWIDKCMRDADDRWRVEKVSHLRSKVAKSVVAAGLCNTGKLRVPEGAAWWPALQNQMAVFDGMGDEHDDMVDAIAIALRHLRMMAPTRALPAEPAKLPERAGVRLLRRVEDLADRAKKQAPAHGGMGRRSALGR